VVDIKERIFLRQTKHLYTIEMVSDPPDSPIVFHDRRGKRLNIN